MIGSWYLLAPILLPVLAGLAATVYLVSMPLSIRAYRRRNS